MSNIPTAHNECKNKELIAKTVLMPGDPMRAKYIAFAYLDSVERFNTVRGNLGYTGTYKGRKISVMASGMGMPSAGIYSYELFKFYDVDNIIRIGSAGSYNPNLNVFDSVLVSKAYSKSNYAKEAFGMNGHTITPSKSLNNKLLKCAKKLNLKLREVICESTDAFYNFFPEHWMEVRDKHKCDVVEMEAFALFATAKALGKKASCLLTISNSFVTGDETTSQQREREFKDMIEIALEMANE